MWCSKSRYKVVVLQGTEGSVQSGIINTWRGDRSRSVGLCFCNELSYKLIKKYCKQDNSPKRTHRPSAGRGSGVMRHIRIRRCPHADNSDDVHVATPAGTNRPDRVDVFALLYLSLHMSSRSLVGVGGRRKKRSALGLANAIAAGELLERGERARSL
jgi:hypothetical protein